MAKTKKIEEMSKEELEIAIIKSEIEHKERLYDEYKKTILEYGFSEFGIFNCALGFKELFLGECKDQGATIIREALKSPDLSEKGILKEKLEYVESKIKRAKYMLDHLPKEIKEKIFDDAVGNYLLWTKSFAYRCKTETQAFKENKKRND